MKTIAVIEKNKCNFEKMEEYALPLLYTDHNVDERKEIKKKLNDYIWSVIEPYIKFVNVEDNEDFMTVVCASTTKCFSDKNPDQFYYHTEGSYSFPKKFIEFVYCQPLWNGYEDAQPENMNNIGCLFSLKHHVIENNCVIMANKYDLSMPQFTVLDQITKEDILKVIRRRYFFTAILVKENSIVKYYYQNPSYLITKVFGLASKDNIEKMSFTHLKYNLIYYFRQDKTKYVNQIATRINGSYRVYGDILILHEMEENIFTNLNIKEIKRINVLSYGRLYDRKLKQEEEHTIPTFEAKDDGSQVEKKIVPLWSRYIVIESRMKTWKQNKNKCINCSKNNEKLYACQKCFRAKYCSKKCEEEFNGYHYDECINTN